MGTEATCMARTEEKYECRLCFPSLTFDRKFLVKRHIMEQHSGFAYTCTGCQMIFPCRDNHTSCHGKHSSSRRMEVVRRSDGLRGSRAQEELKKYTSRIEDFIRVVSPRGFRELSLHPSGRISRTPYPVDRPDRGTVLPSPRASPEPKRTRRSRRSHSSVNPPQERQSPSPVALPARKRTLSVSSSSSSSGSSSCSVAPENPIRSSVVKEITVVPGLRVLIDVDEFKKHL
ncbi:uncharacterized protein LOC128161569 [Crassostrea angulata]|uniref:uncharacterized protein LOC128161569 n=1 Tax=Magallana angulata TaxID=2784310 RepID=UPI0022B0BD28|nr:uncharacterized protein LOC128161569 [Crassostrea angulata]